MTDFDDKRRIEVINFLGGKCVLCSENNPRYLCLHHKNRTLNRWGSGVSNKKGIFSRWYSVDNWKDVVIKEDIMLVCSSCHRKIHGTGNKGVKRKI
jgi:hypothetical protein